MKFDFLESVPKTLITKKKTIWWPQQGQRLWHSCPRKSLDRDLCGLVSSSLISNRIRRQKESRNNRMSNDQFLQFLQLWSGNPKMRRFFVESWSKSTAPVELLSLLSGLVRRVAANSQRQPCAATDDKVSAKNSCAFGAFRMGGIIRNQSPIDKQWMKISFEKTFLEVNRFITNGTPTFGSLMVDAEISGFWGKRRWPTFGSCRRISDLSGDFRSKNGQMKHHSVFVEAQSEITKLCAREAQRCSFSAWSGDGDNRWVA